MIYFDVTAVYTYRGSSVGHSDCERFNRLGLERAAIYASRKNKNKIAFESEFLLCVLNFPSSNHDRETE